MDVAEYKHVVLGLIFLKYISDAFQEHYNALVTEPNADPEDGDEYPLDKQEEATLTVLEQAELLCADVAT